MLLNKGSDFSTVQRTNVAHVGHLQYLITNAKSLKNRLCLVNESARFVKTF